MRSKPFQAVIGTTPFPNFLLDRVMPRLTDTQWRLACVVVRSTFGWNQADGTRKTADWLSHSQLKRKTGRSSAAISQAIAQLVQIGLLLVHDGHGVELTTPAMRRRSHSHLSFSVNPLITSAEFQRAFGHARIQISKSRNNKRNLYKRKQQQLLFSPRKRFQRPSHD